MKQYIIRSCSDDFYAGKTGDGRQVLLGLLCPELVAVFFDRAGHLLNVEFRPLSQLPPRQGTVAATWESDSGIHAVEGIRLGPYQVYDSHFQEALARDLNGWKREINFREAPITVQEFFIAERSLGIRRLPDHLQEFKENPEAFAEGEGERRDLAESVRDWESLGQFVLWWGKDYWMKRDGEVEST